MKSDMQSRFKLGTVVTVVVVVLATMAIGSTFLTNASGISDNGKIVASGLNGHVYVLTPK